MCTCTYTHTSLRRHEGKMNSHFMQQVIIVDCNKTEKNTGTVQKSHFTVILYINSTSATKHPWNVGRFIHHDSVIVYLCFSDGFVIIKCVICFCPLTCILPLPSLFPSPVPLLSSLPSNLPPSPPLPSSTLSIS